MNGVFVESCESTSLLAREHGSKGAPHGFWISSGIQTAGRGRWGRQWQSEPGNLFLSIVLRPKTQQHWTWVPMLGALTALELLAQHFEKRAPGLPLTLKWPNDLWLEGKKLGGLLCESVSSAGQETYLILGFGLNVAHAPQGLDQETASLTQKVSDLDVRATLEWLRPTVAQAIAQAVNRLELEGPGFVAQSFWKHTHFAIGQAVSWIDDSGQKQQGQVDSLGAHGELRVLLRMGSEQKLVSLYAEEIRGLR